MKTIITLLFICSFLIVNGQPQREKAFEINEKLGRGINFGNMFEAPSETGWGNQWQPEYPKMIADLGFNHVRIPIRWEPTSRSDANSPYTINPTFLNRIKQVVDSVTDNGLYAIINMHHHEALYENPDTQKDRFISQWNQISEFFKGYSDFLLFEILNEPHGNLSADKWNVFLADALAEIRKDNPERIVLIGTPEYGGLGGLPKLQIPDDENIILTVHYYNPFQFTHQGASWASGADAWLGTKWNDSETEREIIQNDFAPLVQKGKVHNIPIHIGEFGAYEKAEMKYRKKWTTYMARYIESLNWSWAYWEWSAGFGIYDKSKKVYRQELVDALLHNEMPEPSRFAGDTIYLSNFQNSSDGWNLQTQSSSSGTLARSDNTLNINISNGGYEGWHVQLVKSPVVLQSGIKYRFSFKAKAESERSGTSYIGMTKSPWSSYNGYTGFTMSDTFSVYSVIFDAQSTDSNARMVFDLGNSNINISIKDILLEEIVLVPPTSSKKFTNIKTNVYPNPFNDVLHINNMDKFSDYTILNCNGSTVYSGNLINYTNTISLTNLVPGLYFLNVENESKRHTIKILKK